MIDLQAAPWNALAREYDALFTGPVALAEDAVVATWLRRLLRQLPPDATIIDLGCGTGHLFDLLPEIGPDRYVGLDVSPGMLRVAHERSPRHRFLLRDIRDPLPIDRPCLLVSLYGSPSYIPDPLGAFHAWARAANPGDLLFWMFMSPQYLKRKGHVQATEQLCVLDLPRVAIAVLAASPWLDGEIVGFSPPLPLPMLPIRLHGTPLARALSWVTEKLLVGASCYAPHAERHTYWCVVARRLGA